MSKETTKVRGAVKAYQRGLGATLATYAASLAAAISLNASRPSGWWTLLPLLPGLAIMLVVRRYYNTADEVVQLNMLKAFARGFTVAVGSLFTLGLAATFIVPFPEWLPWLGFALPMVTWGAGGILFERRLK